MVLRHWRDAAPSRVEIIAQYRHGTRADGLRWDPLDGADALLAFLGRTGVRVSAVVALAGVTPGGARDLSRNRAIAEATLAAAAAAGIGRVLIASSSAVYGVGEALDEESPCAPANAYGAAKLEMEAACMPWRDRGVDVCVLRIGNVAGADALLVNVARGDAPITLDIFADGAGPLRSYIGPQSMAEVLETLTRHHGPLPAILNLAAPHPITMAALAQAAGATIRPRPAPATAHQRITLDCSRLAALHRFRAADSDPAEMVRQWQEARAA
jgi:nucleoside-diphosphate-sugar epimerase